MTAIWSQDDTGWRLVSPSGFPAEEALHDLVEQAPNMLPLSGRPQLVMLGREVLLGGNRADLIAVEPSGRLAIIEIKLKSNAEARRAIVAQVLTYAAFLRGLAPESLQSIIYGKHSTDLGHAVISDAMDEADQTGSFDAGMFGDGLRASLASGSFRLVLVLDEAPDKLVRLVGYLESVADKLVIDLITVAAYDIAGSKVMVPQRVEPEHWSVVQDSPKPDLHPDIGFSVVGAATFEEAIANNPVEQRPALVQLTDWARSLETQGLVKLWTYHGKGRLTLLPYIATDDAGLVTIWNHGGASLSFHRSVFERRAPASLPKIEAIVAPKKVGRGTNTANITVELLEALSDAYREAASGYLSSPPDGRPTSTDGETTETTVGPFAAEQGINLDGT